MAEYKKIDAKSMRQTAIAMIDWLAAQELWQDVAIMARGYRYSDSQLHPEQDRHRTRKGTIYYVEKCEDPRTYNKDANPKTITIIFEGDLYTRINYANDGMDFLSDMSDRFLAKYGLFFDMINAYTISAYDVLP